jgi:hypothetical protein
MSLRNRLVLPIILFALAVLVGCGSSTNSTTPPPSGAFSNTNFKGTYTFSVAGEDVGSGSGSNFAMAGSLTACGCTAGTISGGTVDLVDNTGTAPAAAIASSSTYSISKDGRGFAKLLITPTGGTQFEVDVDFVLTSSSHGLISRFDGNGTGSGTIDLQSTVAPATLANLPFAFILSGVRGTSPLSTVGAFTLDSSGTIISTGITDINYNAALYTEQPLTGSVTVGSGTAPGSATLATTSFGSLSFDVYTVDATHLKIIENDGVAILVGDVFSQPSASIPQGNLVFTMSGLDLSGSLFATGGLMASNGVSTIPSGSEDVNDGGAVDNNTNPAVPYSFSGNFSASPAASGRFAVNLTGFVGGSAFAAYPSSGGILMLEIDTTAAGAGANNAGITSGVALVQTAGATVAASQGFGLNNTGEDVFNVTEVDEIAEFKTTSSSGVTGLLDENDFGFALGTSNVNGTYAVNSNGTGSATVSSSLNEIFFYAADNSTVLFISVDPSQAALGSFQAQTTPTDAAQSAAAQPRALPMLRVIPHSRSAKPHSKGLIGPGR